MTIFRSYFAKNNTLIDGNTSNNSQNPVTEISYGTLNEQVTRFILEPNFDLLKERMYDGIVNPNRIVKHVLHMTNTIRYASEYIGKRSYSLEIERASSFELDLFNIPEDWDEGSGYDLNYTENVFPAIVEQAANWYDRKTNVPWSVSGGSYISGVTEILGTQRFETGDEDILIDVTDYVNSRLGLTGNTGTTFTGTSYGLGVKFIDELEQLETTFRQAVAFHAKDTHTFYEPYIETIIDDTIIDDRNYFYLNKDNDLYLYATKGGVLHDVVVNYVQIYDYEDELVTTASGDSIIHVSKGIYKIILNVSGDYPDAVIFRDVWNVSLDGKTFEYENQFYLISDDKYYTFDQSNQINLADYYFYFHGINQQEKIKRGNVRNIKLTIRELYPNQANFLPLEIEYRVFIKVAEDFEIDVIPYTSVDRTSNGYMFDLDTGWLVPQEYYIQLRLKNGSYYENKETLRFTIVSDTLKNI